MSRKKSSRDGPGRENGPATRAHRAIEEGRTGGGGLPRVSPQDCDKFLDGNLEHPTTSSEEIETSN